MEAVGMASSTFARAQKGASLVQRYGDVQGVQEVLGRKDDVPKGSEALLSFLEDWDSEHSM
jgi:hypothetical protein